MSIKDKLRSDSYALGVIMGLVIPLLIFGILFGGLALIIHSRPDVLLRSPHLYKTLVPKFILLSILPSLFLLRYYLINLKFDKTGRGIVISTFIMGVAFIVTQFAL